MKTIISFNRNRAQLRCESFLGCRDDFDAWNQARGFESYSLNYLDAQNLKSDLEHDSVDIFYKGVLSLTEAIQSIKTGLYSWATIKLYYSTYFFIKSSLAINGYALIRKKNLYLLKSEQGATPSSKSDKNHSSDHRGTINYYQKLFLNTDILLSNKINEQTAYEWLLSKREQINYRERTFNEPDLSEFWSNISEYNTSSKLSGLIKKYLNDEKFIYCFQEEHAILAVPLKRFILSAVELRSKSVGSIMKDDKMKFITKLLALNKIQFPFNSYL